MRAAGGVLWRSGAVEPEVCIVHRPRYDDWSLPKGKLSPGEHPLAAAVREVGEETGVRAAPQRRLPPVRYLTGAPGVEKSVTYWAMRYLGETGEPPPADEVDAVTWLPVAAARERLTYAHDRGVLAAFTDVPPVTGVVVVLRHASAGQREEWSGPDGERPLDSTGLADADAAGRLLGVFAPERIVSATPLRCLDTVHPLAVRLDRAVEPDPRFDEEASPSAAADAVRALATGHAAVVVCSQGKLIPALLDALGLNGHRNRKTPKGTAWVVSFAGADPVAVDALDPRPPVFT